MPNDIRRSEKGENTAYLNIHVASRLGPSYFAGFLDRVADEEFQRWQFSVGYGSSYLNPSRRFGDGDYVGIECE